MLAILISDFELSKAKYSLINIYLFMFYYIFDFSLFSFSLSWPLSFSLSSPLSLYFTHLVGDINFK